MKTFFKKILPAPVRAGLRSLQRKVLESRDYLLHLFRHLEKGLHIAWQAVVWFITDRTDVWFGKRDPLIPPERLRDYVGHGGYIQIGQEFLRHFIELGDLQPTDRVLDVGCGIGRIAAPLTAYLTTGSYDGFDIVPTGITWCTRSITPRYPNFRFHLADLYNPAYYTKGRIAAEEYRFPFADSSFDFVFLISVFTHLQSPAMANYLREITRVLRPSGRCFITYFLLNEESMQRIHQGKSTLHFLPADDGTMINHPDIPEAVIAHPETVVRALYHACGLRLGEPIRYGTWCRREDGLSYQDIIIAAKPG